jgi:hypothetical protein
MIREMLSLQHVVVNWNQECLWKFARWERKKEEKRKKKENQARSSETSWVWGIKPFFRPGYRRETPR